MIPSPDPEIRFAATIWTVKIFVFYNIQTEITQAGAATQMAGAAAEAAVAATPLTAESGAEAPAWQHGTTLGEAPAADGGKTARRQVSTHLSPFETETAARTGKENINYLTPSPLTVNNTHLLD